MNLHAALPGIPTNKPVQDAPPADLPRKPRIALYSHDTCGLGHMRRNLLLARTFARTLDADILMITGARESNSLAIPDGVDMLTLPSLFKLPDGTYRPRQFQFGIRDLISIRSRIIRTALESFRPDVFIVDNVPRGVMSELDEVLRYLRLRTTTRCILGLRDILDHPEAVEKEWAVRENVLAIRTYFDAVWIYGDPDIYDMTEACAFPADLRRMVSFTGYLDAQAAPAVNRPAAPAFPFARQSFNLCTVGGGQDGIHVASLFSVASPRQRYPGLILTGPFMPSEARQRLAVAAARHKRLATLAFTPDPTLIYKKARSVVAMGGYNTTCELLSIGKPLLVIPRIRPRQEQWIRARRLHELGLLSAVYPSEVTIKGILDWLTRDHTPIDDLRRRINLNGLSRLPHLIAGHLPVHSAPLPQTAERYVAC